MATGGEVGGTREQRSDGPEDYLCSVCSENGQTTDASHYCPDCDTCYCKACLCDHVVIGRSKVVQWGNSTRSAVKEEDQSVEEEVKCLRHPLYKVELYCVDHDVLCCQMCPSRDHRSCKQMERIAVAAEHVNLSETLQSVRADISTLRKNAEYLSKDSALKKRFKESSHIQYVNQVRAFQEKVNAQFEKTIDESEGHRKHYEDKFDTDQLMCNDIMSKLPELTTALEPMEDKAKHFVSVKRTKEWVEGQNTEMKSVLDTPVTGVFRNVSVSEETNAINVIADAITINMDDMKLTVETKDDDKESNIVGICQLKNGNLVLADRANKCLKQLDENYMVIGRYVLMDSPEGICAMGHSEVAVTTENKHILIVYLGNEYEFRRSLDLCCQPSQVSYDNEILYVTEKSASSYRQCNCTIQLYKYDTFGNQIEILQLGNSGLHYNHGNRHFAFSRDKNKVYVEGDGCLFSVSLKGSDINAVSGYTDSGGICVDKSRCLYISKQNKVLKLSQKEKKPFKTVSAIELKETPGVLCYDNHLDCVVVCFEKGNYMYLRQV